MNVVVVPSGVKKPFALIDRAVIRALTEEGSRVFVLPPGSRFEQGWNELQKRHNPHLVLVLLGVKLTKANLLLLKSLSVPKAVWYTDDPYAIDACLKTCHVFDWIFTNESEAVPVYTQVTRARVGHLPLAAPFPVYAPSRRVPVSYRSRLVLVGSAFRNRLETIHLLAPFLRSYRTKLVGPGWDRLPSQAAFQIRSRWVEAVEVRRYYNAAEIVLNLHRAHDDPYLKQNRRGVRAETPNNRVFEIAACRAFQLADYRRDLEEMYDPEREVVTFRSSEELKEKIRFYLPRKKLRQAIAGRAFRRTLHEHLYRHRIREMLTRIGT
jgi:spore maturation protein CgeB